MYAEFAPPEVVRRHIQSIWVFDPSHPERRRTIRMIQNQGIAEVAFQLGARFRLYQGDQSIWIPRCCLTGFMTRPSHIGPSGPPRTVGIRFAPGGLQAYSRVPCDEFAGQILDARETLDVGLISALETIDAEASTVEVVDHVRRALAHSARDTRPEQQDAVDLFLAAVGRARVRSIQAFCAHTGIHIRKLQRWFRRLVGVSPVRYLRIQRARIAMKRLSSNPDFPLIELALACGYSDQAHLSREFKEIYNLSPSRLAAEGPRSCDRAPEPPAATRRLKLVAGANAIF